MKQSQFKKYRMESNRSLRRSVIFFILCIRLELEVHSLSLLILLHNNTDVSTDVPKQNFTKVRFQNMPLPSWKSILFTSPSQLVFPHCNLSRLSLNHTFNPTTVYTGIEPSELGMLKRTAKGTFNFWRNELCPSSIFSHSKSLHMERHSYPIYIPLIKKDNNQNQFRRKEYHSVYYVAFRYWWVFYRSANLCVRYNDTGSPILYASIYKVLSTLLWHHPLYVPEVVCLF